ncbi:unnamed protein product [Heterobilharzia americana]|nr:unnamed protein product [Heterobilharzia americana]
MDIWNVNLQTMIRNTDNITTENIKYAIGQTLQLRAELNARQDKVRSCLDEGKQLSISFQRQEKQYFKSNSQQSLRSGEISPPNILITTEIQQQTPTSIGGGEEEQHTTSSLTKTGQKTPIVDTSVKKEDTDSEVIPVRPEYFDCHLKSVRINEKHEQKSDASSLSQTTVQIDDHFDDENDQIIEDLQLRMTQLLTSWHSLHIKWHHIYRRLELQLGINEFASVADSLEHWLVLHSSEVESLDTGDSIKETLTLIDRLDILERNFLPQNERYERVKQLTKFELIDKGENLMNQPISCVNISHSSDMEELETLLYHYGLVRSRELNDQTDPLRNEERSDCDLRDITELMGHNGKVMENQTTFFQTISDYLMRKHEWSSRNCKSRDRSWYELFMVLNMSVRQLLAYKAKSDYDENNPQRNTFHGEMGLLVGPNLITASETLDYTKRPNTFRVTVTHTGAQYLFQAPSAEIMLKWISSIQNINQNTRLESRPTLITLSRPSEELGSPMVIINFQGTPTTSKKSTLTQIFKSKTTQQISCIRRHSSDQNNDVKDFVENLDSSQIGIRRFPSVRTMKALSAKQLMRWLTFKYSSISCTSFPASHQTSTLLRSSTSHDVEREQPYQQPIPLLRKSHTSGSLHKISKLSVSAKCHQEI